MAGRSAATSAGTPYDVLILGGGIAGLACAVALRGTGLRILLVEKLGQMCGRARSCEDRESGDRVDLGPHVLASEYPNLLALLATLGTADRVVWHEDELITLRGWKETVSLRLSRLPAPLHLFPSLLKVRDVSLRDKASNMRALLLALRLRPHELMQLDDVPATDLLERLGVSSRFRDWFWRSATLSLMNVPLEQCSGAAMMRYFSQLIGHSHYCFGFPACALDELFWPAARRVLEESRCEVRTAEQILARVGRPRSIARMPAPFDGIAGLVNRLSGVSGR